VKAGSKYQPLQEYLSQSNRSEQVVLTFAEIETLIGSPLPKSARSSRAWWSNRGKGALQAAAWMNSGYLAEEVDLQAEQVVFRKPTRHYHNYPIERVGDTVLWNSELIKALRQHMGLSQAEFADHLGVRQQTISEWETHAYTPRLVTSKFLTLVAEQVGFQYGEDSPAE
jgi:DNA-binding transcriptional regulator YiaG